MVARPKAAEYPAYYSRYLQHVPEGDILELLDSEMQKTLAVLRSVDEEKASFRYAPGKWSVKEVLGHIIDSERIFAVRALHFARNEKQALIGFEQDDYVREACFDQADLSELIEEFIMLRAADILMFRNFPEAAWSRTGIANGLKMSVRSFPFIMLGHEIHHRRILQEKYHC